MMGFDIHELFFDMNDEELEAFHNELIQRFEASPEGKAFLKGEESDWADLFVDVVIYRMGVSLPYLRTNDFRDILYHIIPAHVIVQPEEAPNILAELKAFWQFIKREFQLKNADACLKVLNQKHILKRFTAELSNPENYGVGKQLTMQMMDADVDLEDEEQVMKFIEGYNAQIQESMKPPAVSDKAQKQHKAVKKLIEQVCKDHLNQEYAQLSLKLLDNMLFQFADKFERGQAKSWAAAIVHTIGRVNFLFDPSQDPHLSAGELSKKFNVSQGTASAKSSQIFDWFDLMPFHPEWTLPSRIDDNPLTWMLSVNGLLMDIRHAPREAQEEAYRMGLIPYIPADK